jgi:hypothetical protein
MKNLWLEEAERKAKNVIGKGKTIILDGTATLGLLSVTDYLVNHHGYRYVIKKKG